MAKKLAATAAIVLLAGCAAGWHKPGSTEAQFYQDRVQCESQAMAAYPVVLVASGGYQTPSATRCTSSFGAVNCQTTPGVTYPGTTQDANAIGRSGMFSACMRGRGYVFKIN